MKLDSQMDILSSGKYDEELYFEIEEKSQSRENSKCIKSQSLENSKWLNLFSHKRTMICNCLPPSTYKISQLLLGLKENRLHLKKYKYGW